MGGFQDPSVVVAQPSPASIDGSFPKTITNGANASSGSTSTTGGAPHKVVAMPVQKDPTSSSSSLLSSSPSSSSKSAMNNYQNFLSSQQQQEEDKRLPNDEQPQRKERQRSLTPGRRTAFHRPKSPGRNVSRSRDIVQEVYERMGVQYTAGGTTIELDDNTSVVSIQSGGRNNHKNSRASISKSPGRRKSTNNNRSSTATTASGAVSVMTSTDASTIATDDVGWRRSTGGGKINTNLNTDNYEVNVEKEDDRNDDEADGSFPTATNHRSAAATTTKTTTKQTTTTKSVVSLYRQQRSTNEKNSNEDDDDARQDHHSYRTSVSTARSIYSEKREKSTSRTNTGNDGRTSPAAQSIKSRISAFGGGKGVKGNKSLQSIKSRNPSSYRKSDSAVAASFLAAVSSSSTTPQKKTSSKQQSTVSRGATGGGAADGQSVGKTISSSHTRTTTMSRARIPIEIHPSDYSNDPDDHSIAASSVSGEDFAGASTKTPRSVGQSVSSMSRKFAGGGGGYHQTSSSRTAYKSATEQMIERIVNDQIATKLQEMAETMSAEIQKVRDETKARVDELEQKLMVLNMGHDDTHGGGGAAVVAYGDGVDGPDSHGGRIQPRQSPTTAKIAASPKHTQSPSKGQYRPFRL